VRQNRGIATSASEALYPKCLINLPFRITMAENVKFCKEKEQPIKGIPTKIKSKTSNPCLWHRACI